jgi:dipeptidyl-peptidase-4
MTPRLQAGSRLLTAGLAGIAIAAPGMVAGSEHADVYAELHRIFEAEQYEAETFGPAKWLDGGMFYTTLEPSATNEGGRDIIRYETSKGTREVLVPSSRMVPEGETQALEIDDYAWSDDKERLLLFTNAERVWRQKTRGDYWVLRLATGELKQLGGDAEPSSLKFAKFSPDGDRVAYVRENDLFVEDIASGRILPLTSDGSEHIVNGTGEWVYEEEFGVRDGFRWSPDGERIAFWSFDSSGIQGFALINNTDTLYPEITYIPYPKVGTTNPAARVGVVSSRGGDVRWMDVPGDPRNNYIARMDWAGDSDTLVLQHLNRPQNRNDLLLADVPTGKVRRIHREETDTWLDVMEDFVWLRDGSELLWLSEAHAWRHAYRVARDGSGTRQITRFEADVIDLVGVDGSGDWLYFTAAPGTATERQLFREPIDGNAAPERVSPSQQPGTHRYDLAPSGEWAFHTYSRFDTPPRIELIRLPTHESVRTLVDNGALAEKLEHLLDPPAEFFQTDIGDGVQLDSWMIKPSSFDPESEYPLLVFVYGEPWNTTVVDEWGGSRMLFHRVMARAGFVVVSFDNRGTPAPRGVAWRKIVHGSIGELSSREQAAAVEAFAREHPFVDVTRVAIWGWSGGGSNTLNCLFRHPEVFKVGVSVAPVPDQTLYDTIYQERYMGLPAENAEGYRIGSPINFAEGLEGQLLLIHGSGDDNVHYQGTERLVNRLIALGKRFDMMVYPNRSHSIREGKGTKLHIHSLIARYLLEARW